VLHDFAHQSLAVFLNGLTDLRRKMCWQFVAHLRWAMHLVPRCRCEPIRTELRDAAGLLLQLLFDERNSAVDRILKRAVVTSCRSLRAVSRCRSIHVVVVCLVPPLRGGGRHLFVFILLLRKAVKFALTVAAILA